MLIKLSTTKSIEKDYLEKNEMFEAKAGVWMACFSKLFTVAEECQEVGGTSSGEAVLKAFYEAERQG